MKVVAFIARCWYYFRTGYGTYLVALLGYVSTLVTVYYLAIRNMPDLETFFQKFSWFAVLATLIGVPLSVILGWVHVKRSGLYKAEIDIAVEANPYNYMLAPGYWKEAAFPAYLETLRLVKALCEKEGLLTPDCRQKIDQLERKFEILIKGGYVGTPRRKMNFSQPNV